MASKTKQETTDSSPSRVKARERAALEAHTAPEPTPVFETTGEGREVIAGFQGPLVGTVKDGLEDAPEVRVGEVFESLAPHEDDHRRFVKVIGPLDDDGNVAPEDGKVLVENISTYRKSQISVDRLTPEEGWRRFHS